MDVFNQDLCISEVKEVCNFLDCKPTELDSMSDDYVIYTDGEADEACAQHILECIWAFRPWFLAGLTKIDESVFTAIASNDQCEDNNEAILSIVKGTCGVEHLVAAAISADGRGHFISSYDGEEVELNVSTRKLYIYRI